MTTASVYEPFDLRKLVYNDCWTGIYALLIFVGTREPGAAYRPLVKSNDVPNLTK